MSTNQRGCLRSCLIYEPVELRFGTSGRRGQVVDLTQLEIYINALAEIEYLQSLPFSEGGLAPGDPFYLAYDLRPSSTGFDPQYGGRGEICQTVALAAEHAGMRPVNLGAIPTPALAYYALSVGKGSAMVTGSHIPFDRNGYKLNTAKGELLKLHEQPINEAVRTVRERIYGEACELSIFDKNGMLKQGQRELSPADPAGAAAYVQRYEQFFGPSALSGLRILLYQHSAVGRDLVADILTRLGADVIQAGRSKTFVPIDTENIDARHIAIIQNLADTARSQHGRFDAVISTDGDSDRPLVLGVTADGQVQFFGGDLLGMVVAEFLQADAVVVPVSCNDAVDLGPLANVLEPKTKIGSPYVIAGMEAAARKGRQTICGWEANGGFLTGSDVHRNGVTLKALPTRDAVLPILCVLFATKRRNLSVIELFTSLPPRFSRAALVKSFPRPKALAILGMFLPSVPQVKEVVYGPDSLHVFGPDGQELQPVPSALSDELRTLGARLEHFFATYKGFHTVMRINYTDGLRISFDTGDVVHLRPSGNADEMRIYAVANTQERANEIVDLGVLPGRGIIHSLASASRGMTFGGWGNTIP